MAIQKIVKKKTGISDPNTYVGNYGDVFLNPDIPDLRYSDGSTPGGLSLSVVGVATYAPLSGVSNYAITAGVATYSSRSGVSTYAVNAGVSTYSTYSGFSTSSNYSILSGISSYCSYSPLSGVSTYATIAGVSTTSQGLTGTPDISVGRVNVSSFLSVTGLTSFYNDVHFEYDKYVLIGNNNELQLFHNGTNSYIDNSSTNNLIIRTHGGAINLVKEGPEYMGVFNTDGSVELYYNNSRKFETTSIGATVYGTLTAPQLNISGIITAPTFSGNATSSTVAAGLTGTPDISVNKVSIASTLGVNGVASFYDDLHLEYDKSLIIGNNNELQLSHNGVNSYIDNFSGNNLVIRDNGAGIQLRRYGGGAGAGLMANFNTGAGVELYYNSVLKLQTFQSGVAINDSVGIGSTAGNPPYRLTVSGIGATTTPNLLNAIADLTSSVNGYGQVNIRNSFAGSNSSGDLIVTADNGTDTANYIDLGINNSSFSNGSWTINGAGDGYLYTSDSNLSIGVASTNKYLSFFAGGTLSSNEIIRVTSSSAIIGSAVTITSGGIRATGIVTANSFRPSSGYIQAADGTNSFYIYSSTGNVSFQGNINVNQINSGSGYSGLTFSGGSTPSVQVPNGLVVTGISTLGILTSTDTRLNSTSEKSTVAVGNTVSLVYNTGGGNIAICTNPSGAITLNVTGIPTDSTFNNRVLTFTVFVNQGTTGYACTTVTLNGVSVTVKYPGGVTSVGSTSSYDVFNITCINPTGSASTTSNYVALGMVNGNFK